VRNSLKEGAGATKGRMLRFSPMETPAALILRIGEAIIFGATDDELRMWRTTCLTCSFHWHFMENEEAAYFAAVQKRETFAVDYGTQAFTARQWVYFVNSFKEKSIRKSGAKNVSTQVLANSLAFHVAGPSGATNKDENGISHEFVKKCVTVHDDLFANKKVANLIEAAEAKWGLQSPFNSVTKLYWISVRTKSKVVLVWALEGILDLVKAGLMDASDLSVRLIKGEGSGGKGIIDLMTVKMEMRDHLFSNVLEGLAIRSEVKQKIRDAYSNHSTFRQHMGFPDEGCELMCQGGWWQSEIGTWKRVPARTPTHARPILTKGS
jgi:hypothetical protein